MLRRLCCSIVLGLSVSFVGCGGTSEAIPAATEAGTDPTPEEQRNWMEESARMGGAPEGYELPETGTQDEGAPDTPGN